MTEHVLTAQEWDQYQAQNTDPGDPPHLRLDKERFSALLGRPVLGYAVHPDGATVFFREPA